jgi:hypothetical protein
MLLKYVLKVCAHYRAVYVIGTNFLYVFCGKGKNIFSARKITKRNNYDAELCFGLDCFASLRSQ